MRLESVRAPPLTAIEDPNMDRLLRLPKLVVVAILLAGVTVLAQQDTKPLDNEEILTLEKLDLGDAVTIAKIRAAKTVKFAIGTEDLVKLKTAGVSSEIIVAMLDRVTADNAAMAATPSRGAPLPKVTLQTKDASTELKVAAGESRAEGGFGVTRYVVFLDRRSPIRTLDRKPVVTIAANEDPRLTFYLVRVDPEDGDDQFRSVVLRSGGIFGGFFSSEPDGDSLVKYKPVESEPGLWRFAADEDLDPGEYGVYVSKGAHSPSLFGFGIDKAPRK
jgi:hypothetical protein